MKSFRFWSTAALAVSIAALLASTAVAQQPSPAQTDDPYAPQGTRLGGFILMPKLKVSETYDDNVFRDNTNEKDDFITVVTPSVALRSDWNNHALNFRGSLDSGHYASNDDENYTDFSLGADGRIDIQRDTALTAAAQYISGHEDRASPDDVNGIEPTETEQTSGRVALSHRFNRLKLTGAGEYLMYNYDDVRGTAGIINNDDRDHDRIIGSLRADYDVHPDFDIFVEGLYNTVNYDAALDDNGVNRDSDGYEGRGGVSLGLTDLITGDFYVGYLSQDMDDPSLQNVDGFTYGADLTWEVTRLTQVLFGAARTIQQTTSGGSSAILQNQFRAGVIHELRRNIILEADLRYILNEYEGISREDDVYEGSLAATYMLNRYVGVEARYRYLARESDVTTADFTSNAGTLSLVLQY